MFGAVDDNVSAQGWLYYVDYQPAGIHSVQCHLINMITSDAGMSLISVHVYFAHITV